MSDEAFREKVDKLGECVRKRKEIMSSPEYRSKEAFRSRIESLSKDIANGFKEEE